MKTLTGSGAASFFSASSLPSTIVSLFSALLCIVEPSCFSPFLLDSLADFCDLADGSNFDFSVSSFDFADLPVLDESRVMICFDLADGLGSDSWFSV